MHRRHHTRKNQKTLRNPKEKAQKNTHNHKSAHHHPKFPPTHMVEGTIRISTKGIGFVDVLGMKEDIEIDPESLNTALDQDRVRIILYGKKIGERQKGEVANILYRNKKNFVGIIDREGGSYILIPDDMRVYRPILIPSQCLAGARKGDKVVVKMTSWANNKKDPLGEVVRVLGKPDTHNVEMEALVIDRGFDTMFPLHVLKEAEKIRREIGPSDILDRRDFRNTLTFTIDPKDAKDFDDALSWRKLPNGNYEIGIHIADVSHYVAVGSVIDKEALQRGTSIYLVDRTIPMLPERLSNDICSLIPNDDRLTLAAVFEIRKDGKIINEWFGPTIIHSVHRFTYEEAQKIIDDKKGEHADALLALNSLAQKIRAQRISSGSIAFETQEVRFELNKNGKPVGIHKKILLDSNKLIEEFMLLANRQVAHLIATKDARSESVFVYRVHDIPDEDRMRDLRDFLHGIGYKLHTEKNGAISSQHINKILEDVRGRAEEEMVHIATIRAMAKAAYTTKNIGHFGLAFDYYTHFTSPIRRYPDLLVHRLLKGYLNNKPISKKVLEEHEHLARYCSQMEIAAADAERASVRYKQCEYFAERIGVQLRGKISGVTEWGIFVEDEETRTEGMVHVRDIPNDFYFFEEKNYRLIGKTHKKTYRLGDKIDVIVSSVDLKKKLISMKIVA